MKRKVLITGGGGYLGYRIAQRYLATTDDELILWLRAGDAETFADRRRACDALFGSARGRVHYARGDLADAAPFEHVNPREVKAIFHPAANTRFDIDAGTARAVNVAGTERVFDFARRCLMLESIALVSTIYSSGLRSGVVAEALLDGRAGFANHYESSKAASEACVREYSDLPWRVFRTATVLADDGDGVVLQYNIAHKVKRLMYAGLLPIFPGTASMPMFFVTGDFVTDAMFAAVERGPLHTVFNLCHSAEESLTLGDWLGHAYDCFQDDADFASRHFMRPIMTDLATFRCLAASVGTFSRDVVMQAVVKLVSPFAEQMFVSKAVQNDRVREALPDYRAPDPRALLSRVCAHLAASRWGARPVAGRMSPARLWEA